MRDDLLKNCAERETDGQNALDKWIDSSKWLTDYLAKKNGTRLQIVESGSRILNSFPRGDTRWSVLEKYLYKIDRGVSGNCAIKHPNENKRMIDYNRNTERNNGALWIK